MPLSSKLQARVLLHPHNPHPVMRPCLRAFFPWLLFSQAFLFRNNKTCILCRISDPPFAPRDLTVVEYNVDSVTLSWSAPEHDGGSPILGYVIEKRDSMMNMWSQAAKVDSSTFTVNVTNLFEGQNYFFRVAAENQCGRGAYTELAKPVLTKLPFGKFYVVFSVFFITA